MNLDTATIAVVGLGYVGLPLAVAFARTRPVVGFDLKAARIDGLRAGRDVTREADDDELAAARYLKFTSAEADLAGCEVFVVAVPTPIDRASHPDLRLLRRASETVGKAMRQGAVVVYEFDCLSRLHRRGVRADPRSHLWAEAE